MIQQFMAQNKPLDTGGTIPVKYSTYVCVGSTTLTSFGYQFSHWDLHMGGYQKPLKEIANTFNNLSQKDICWVVDELLNITGSLTYKSNKDEIAGVDIYQDDYLTNHFRIVPSTVSPTNVKLNITATYVDGTSKSGTCNLGTTKHFPNTDNYTHTINGNMTISLNNTIPFTNPDTGSKIMRLSVQISLDA